MRIKKLIKEKGLTIKEVAERMGVQSSSLSRAINENTTVEMLKKIANAIDVPVSELFEQPNENVVNCPNCGARLVLKKEE